MTTAAFPISIGVLQDSFSERRETNRAELIPPVGAPKLRNRAEIEQRVMTVSAWLTTAQLASLDTFYNTTTKSGALPFTWTHPRTAEAGVFQFEGEPPQVVDVNGANYKVSFSVRALQVDTLYRLIDSDFSILVDSDGSWLVTT